MAPKSVVFFKFVGSISLGLLTGLSYTLSTLTLPTLLSLPSAITASQAFTTLTKRTIRSVRLWSIVSASSFVLAYALSPRGERHPYLLWTTMLVSGSGVMDIVLEGMARKEGLLRPARLSAGEKRVGKGKMDRLGRMEASYDVVGDSEEGGSASEEGGEEEVVNGEQVRNALEGFRLSQIARLGLVGVGFMMSVVGIWGDGA